MTADFLLRSILSLLLILCWPSLATAFTQAQYEAAIRNIQAYHDIRRDEVGNTLLVFFAIARMFFLGLPIPVTLQNVLIECHPSGGVLLFSIRGIEHLANAMVNASSDSHASPVAYLLDLLYHFGMVQHVTSDAFFAGNNEEKSRIYLDPNSTITLFHNGVNQIANYERIRSLPVFHRGGGGERGRNKIYSDANKIGFFVSGSRKKYSSNGLMKDHFGGRSVRIQKILAGMKSRVMESIRNDERAQVQQVISKNGRNGKLVTCAVQI